MQLLRPARPVHVLPPGTCPPGAVLEIQQGRRFLLALEGDEVSEKRDYDQQPDLFQEPPCAQGDALRAAQAALANPRRGCDYLVLRQDPRTARLNAGVPGFAPPIRATGGNLPPARVGVQQGTEAFRLPWVPDPLSR